MLTPFPDTILDIPIGISPQIVMAVVFFLMICFLWFCFRPALITWWQLKSARSQLNKIHREKQNVLIEKNALSIIFKSKLFQEAWNSFKDTLHEQYEYQAGIQQITNIRATAPAEAFFSQQTIIDSRINIEFFKHLPGILTGIGIIGTFWGLIHGIQSFDPSLLAKARLDPAQMDLLFNGLKQLFLEVQGAFIASAVAIAGAMIVTLAEKVSINACYYRLEQLCLKLDALYEGGVAEVYLAALVKSSAENVTHTAQLKASLVTELSELLRELTDRQIKQSEVFATMLADKLTGKIQEQMDATANHGEQFRTELKSGLDNMGDKVAKIAGGQGDTMTGMLEQLIEKFSGTISSTFNEQMQGIGGMINQAATSMQTTQAGFDGLINDLRDTGAQERQAANEQMLQLMTAIDNRQETSQAQMQGFIDAINTQISNAQQNNSEQIRNSLKEIQLSTQKILADIKQDSINARVEEQKQQELFADAMSSKFTDQMKRMGSMFMHTSTAMQTMQGGFETLMTDLRDTGTQERQAVNSEIQELVTLIGQQQVALQSQMTDFISAINTQISNAQQDNSNQIRDSLHEIQSSTRQILADMDKERNAAIAVEQQRQQQFANTVSDTFTQQVDNVSGMLEQTSTAIQTMKGGFETLMTDLRETGTQERQAVNSEIQDLVTLIGQQQVTLQSQMESFISAINTQISNAQQDNSKQIRESLIEIQSSTRQILVDMDKERAAAIAVEQERQQQFANTVSSTFTQQVDNVGGMLEKTSTAMQTMQGGFETLMQNLRDTGEHERKAVSAEMSALVKEIDDRQTAAQTNISDFVNSIATGHQDTLKITQENLTELQASTRKILADMEQERAALLKAERDRQQAFVDSSNALISKMESQISALVTQVSDTMSALKDNTIELNNASDKMTVGAEQISQASTDFAAAGDKVSGVIGQTEKLSTQLIMAGDQMSSAADVLETQLKEYTATRELLGQMINEMENLLKRAKQEAGVNQQIVADMQKMVSSFGVLKDDMDDFVKQVGGLLAETLAKFQNDMATHNTEFHKHHADTLTKVANAYQPLSASISGLIDMFAKTNNRGV